MKTITILLTIGMTTAERELTVNNNLTDEQILEKAKKKYSSIINMGGSIKYQPVSN